MGRDGMGRDERREKARQHAITQSHMVTLHYYEEGEKTSLRSTSTNKGKREGEKEKGRKKRKIKKEKGS